MDEWIQKCEKYIKNIYMYICVCVYIYHSVSEKKEILPDNMDGARGHYAKRNKTEKNKHCMISLICAPCSLAHPSFFSLPPMTTETHSSMGMST